MTSYELRELRATSYELRATSYGRKAHALRSSQTRHRPPPSAKFVLVARRSSLVADSPSFSAICEIARHSSLVARRLVARRRLAIVLRHLRNFRTRHSSLVARRRLAIVLRHLRNSYSSLVARSSSQTRHRSPPSAKFIVTRHSVTRHSSLVARRRLAIVLRHLRNSYSSLVARSSSQTRHRSPPSAKFVLVTRHSSLVADSPSFSAICEIRTRHSSLVVRSYRERRFSHTSTHAAMGPVVAMFPVTRSTSPSPS